MRRLFPLALLPVLAAGCLFGGKTHYTVEKTTPCLKKHFKVFPQDVPGTGVKLEGLLGLDSPGHYVAFYRDEKAAKEAQVDFLHRAAQSGAAGSDTVEQKGNVVIILASEDRTQDSTILDCLK
jgi:hypothetical protein